MSRRWTCRRHLFTQAVRSLMFKNLDPKDHPDIYYTKKKLSSGVSLQPICNKIVSVEKCEIFDDDSEDEAVTMVRICSSLLRKCEREKNKQSLKETQAFREITKANNTTQKGSPMRQSPTPNPKNGVKKNAMKPKSTLESSQYFCNFCGVEREIRQTTTLQSHNSI